ncbi:MAG: UDP-N-acetylmuramoyl-L-alanine--D-glutamate ligase [Armatimonadota bacterium]
MTEKEFAGRTVAVIGMARTGMAAAEVLTDLGARVILFDQQPANKLESAINEAKKLGVEVKVEHPGVDFDGVDLLIPSPGVRATSPIFTEAKARGVEIMSEIELAYRISKAPMIAITGTNGKTTTTVLTGKIMEADGRETYIGGNVAAGGLKLPLVKAAHQASPDAVIVAEISTFQLEWISSFKPKVAMLLNITVDHPDRHTPEEYAFLKESIYRYQDSNDYSVSNLDNSPSAAAGSRAHGQKLIFSRLQPVEQGAFVEDRLIKVRIGGRETVACSIEDIESSGSLPGTHNIENVLAASCAAIAMGAKPESIVTAVRNFAGVEHRMEKVLTAGGVEYINNSMCTNAEAFARSVESVGRPAVVIAGGKHKGGSLEQVAQAVKKYAKHLVLIGASADEIEEAVRETGYTNITRAASMDDAVAKAAALAAPGDTVILAPGCASFDMFISFEERGDVFKSAVKQQVSLRWEKDEKGC